MMKANQWADLTSLSLCLKYFCELDKLTYVVVVGWFGVAEVKT